MGLREKVAIVSLAIIFIQIACRHCMPRNINTPQLKSRRLKRISAAYLPSTENTDTKNFQTSNSIKTKNDKTKKAKNKYSLNLLTKLIKEAKTQNGETTKATLDPLSPYSKPFATTPQPFCYKELGTFPEVEYPMYVMDTWAPKYWKTLPTVQKMKGEPTNDCSEIKTPESKNIKPSKKAIEKAISALIKLRSKGVDKVPKDNVCSPPQSTPTTSQDICPLDPPNQCLPTEKPSVSNTSAPISNTTCIPPTNSASVKDLCDTTTATTFIENDLNQLPTPTATTSEYEYEVIPTATTAMPSFGTSPINSALPTDELALISTVPTNSVPATLPINSPTTSAMSNDIVTSSNCDSSDPCDDAFSPTDSLSNLEGAAPTSVIHKAPTSGATSAVNPILPSDETTLPLIQAVPITAPLNSIPIPDSVSPAIVDNTPANAAKSPVNPMLSLGATDLPLAQAVPVTPQSSSLPVSDTALPTSVVDSTAVSEETTPVSPILPSNENAIPLTQAIPITPSSNSPSSVVDSTPVGEQITPVSPILPSDDTALPLAQAVPTEDTVASNLLPTSDTSPDNNFGLSDYDFATMPPPDISYDTTIKNVNPDDMSTKFSPGDTDYIWTQ